MNYSLEDCKIEKRKAWKVERLLFLASSTSQIPSAPRWLWYLWIFQIFFSLALFSCGAEEGNYTAVYQDGLYVYGIWNARKIKRAENLSRQIRQAVESEPSHVSRLPTMTITEPIELLPEDKDASDWVRSRKPSTYIGKELYKDVFGGNPELYHTYGFIKQANAEYQTPQLGSQPLILVEIFDMGTPENAFGLYTHHRYPQDEFEWVGSKAIISGRQLSFWKGKYFIQIGGYEFASQIKQGMIELAKATAEQIKDPPTKPPLLSLLPLKNQVPYSEKYYPSNSTLREMNRSLPESLLALSKNVEGCSAAYPHEKSSTNWMDTMTVFLIRYSSEPEAKAGYEAYRRKLETNASAVDSVQPGRIIAKE